MSDKRDDLIREAMCFGTPIIYGSVFGPPGVVIGAVAAVIVAALDKNYQKCYGSAPNESQSNKTGSSN
ncbi:hypothetical protein GC163_20490 [bacterium]|nr:hypothetical protein [bacterium]